MVRNGEEVGAIWQGFQPVALAPMPSACLIIALVGMAGVLQGDHDALPQGRHVAKLEGGQQGIMHCPGSCLVVGEGWLQEEGGRPPLQPSQHSLSGLLQQGVLHWAG